jgi:hypothetical protein
MWHWTTLLVVDLHAKGTVDLRCDHCNAPLAFALEGSQKQIFRLTGEEQYDDGELVSLEAGAHSVNLTHYIYECLRLALPIRHVHAPGECDPEVEQVLERLRVSQEPLPDPRWGVLDQLKNQPYDHAKSEAPILQDPHRQPPQHQEGRHPHDHRGRGNGHHAPAPPRLQGG